MVYFLFLNDTISTGYPTLDWYKPHKEHDSTSAKWSYSVLSGTSLHIVEMGALFFSFYIHRHFPKEFSLSTEMILNMISGWFFNSVLDVANALKTAPHKQLFIFDAFRLDAVVDLLRCFTFIVIIYVVTMRTFSFFPLPFTWVFRDFSKFLFEPQCISVFLQYLREREPDKVDIMNRFMKLYVNEFDKPRESDASKATNESTYRAGTMFMTTAKSMVLPPSRGTDLPPINPRMREEGTQRAQFLEIMTELEPSFNRYKKTKSALTLYSRLREFEQITEHNSSRW